MSLIVNFRRRSLLYQTLVVAVVFLSFYSIYMQYLGKANIGDSLLATAIFSASYLLTSTIVLRRSLRRKI